LFLDAMVREVADLHSNLVRLRFIGNRALLGVELKQRMHDAEVLTANNSGLGLMVAVAYGGRWDIARACQALAADVAAGSMAAADIGEEQVAAKLELAGIPDPDLLIRTGGEQRISNFLLWNLAYTELYFSEALWPEFSPVHLQAAFEHFAQRERRFGKTSEQVGAKAGA
jgi:undecaprenyl diphosphate synthase